MEDTTDVTVPMDGLEVIANKLWIGVKALHVKTMRGVLNKELHFTATVLEAGRESYAMYNKSHVKLLPKIEVYLALSYVKMEVTAKIQMTEPTVMNAFAYLDLKEVIVRKILMSVRPIHAKMVRSAKI